MPTTPVLDGRTIPKDSRIQEIVQQLKDLSPGDSLVLIAPHEPAKLLQLLVDDSSISLNWAPLEKGPDHWRWHFTARVSGTPRSVGEYLVWDHRRLEALLAQSLKLARAGLWPEAVLRFDEYDTGLRHHADVEDVILFPAYEEASGNLPDGPAKLMMEEHHDVRLGLDRLLRAVRGNEMGELQDAFGEFADELEGHHAKEEEILFPSIDTTLDQQQLRALVEKMLLA